MPPTRDITYTYFLFCKKKPRYGTCCMAPFSVKGMHNFSNFCFTGLLQEVDQSGWTMSIVLVQNRGWVPARETRMELKTVVIMRMCPFTVEVITVALDVEPTILQLVASLTPTPPSLPHLPNFCCFRLVFSIFQKSGENWGRPENTNE